MLPLTATPPSPAGRGDPGAIVCADAEGAARAAAALVADAADRALAERSEAHLLLGSGPLLGPACEALADMIRGWAGVHLWVADEPCVAPDHPASTGRAIAESLPAARLHRIVGDGLPRLAAVLHAAEMRRLVPAAPGTAPVVDAALLALESDGTLSSLAPCGPALAPGPRICLPVRLARPPCDRITVSMDVVRAARTSVVLAAGAATAGAVAAVRRGPSPARPGSLLAARRTRLVADRGAARFLRE